MRYFLYFKEAAAYNFLELKKDITLSQVRKKVICYHKRIMNSFKILNKKLLWEGKYLRTVRITYKGGEGDLRYWEAVERVNCNGIVAIVPVTKDGHVIFVRQFRPPVNSYVIEFPAGLNDMNEPLEVVALRELLEETGYTADKLIFLAKGPLSTGLSKEILMVYLANNAELAETPERDEAEDIEVLNIPIDEVNKALELLEKEGNLIDLKIPGLLELARKHL